MNKKLAVAVSGGAVVVLALAGCGGDNGQEERDQWAQKVCDRVQPQVAKIQKANTAIAEATDEQKSSREVKETDSAAFRQISQAYGALANAVNDAGEPPVEEGAQLRKDAVKELKDISASYGDLKKTVDELDTQEQAKFATGLKEVADQLQKLGRSGDQALNQLQSGDLGEAMAKQQGCKSPTVPASSDRRA